MSNLIEVKRKGIISALQDHIRITCIDGANAIRNIEYWKYKDAVKHIATARRCLDDAEKTFRELRKMSPIK